MDMPLPNAGVIACKDRIVARLRAALPGDAVISEPQALRVYECDALSAYRCPPLAAVLPRTTEEVATVLRTCWEEGVPVVPRGSGTSLTGSGASKTGSGTGSAPASTAGGSGISIGCTSTGSAADAPAEDTAATARTRSMRPRAGTMC